MRTNISIADKVLELVVAAASESDVRILTELFTDHSCEGVDMCLHVMSVLMGERGVTGVSFSNDHYIRDSYLEHIGFVVQEGERGWHAFQSSSYPHILLYRRRGSNRVLVYKNVGKTQVDAEGNLKLVPIEDADVELLGRVTKVRELMNILKPLKG